MNHETPEALRIEPEYRIRGCNTLEELYFVLRDLGEVQGMNRTYPAEKIITSIQSAADRHQKGLESVVEEALEGVTRTFGIRDKARELVSKLPVDTYYSRQE